MHQVSVEEVSWLRDRYALTAKELEVAALMLSGCSSRQIADHLAIRLPTVEAHRAHIRRKLGVRSAAGLFQAVLSRGLEPALSRA